jgi:outer membrane protein assembly factor BamB
VFAIDINTGESLWKGMLGLHAPPVPWGMALDRDGRIIVTLKDGHIMCFGPAI